MITITGSAPAPAVRQIPPPCRHAARAWRWPAARRRRTCTSPAVRTTRRTRGCVPTEGAPDRRAALAVPEALVARINKSIRELRLRWARGAAGARRRAEFAARHHPPTARSARGRSAVTILRACLGARRVTIHRLSAPTVGGHHPPTCGTSPSADRTLGARPRSGHHPTGVLRRAAHHHPPAFARTDFR